MKIVSWNVAGLRACLNKGLDRFVAEDKADIYCFQESKVKEEQNQFHPLGYREYLYPAEKKGYSGFLRAAVVHGGNQLYSAAARLT